MPDVPASGRRLRIAHLYPSAMDLYGDIGNVLALVRRCQWRGIAAEVVPVDVGCGVDLAGVDMLIMGGGQDSAQSHIAYDLRQRGEAVRDLIARGLPALVVCGGFQLFGTSYVTSRGEAIPGIGVFNAYTVAGPKRLVGNVAIETRLQRYGAAHAQAPLTVIGFENHSGLTYLGQGTRPFGRVLTGAGNLGDGAVEGAVYRNAIGTYLHGPLLPKNPRVADHLITAALAYRYGAALPLQPLDDALEISAHDVAMARCETGRVAGPHASSGM